MRLVPSLSCVYFLIILSVVISVSSTTQVQASEDRGKAKATLSFRAPNFEMHLSKIEIIRWFGNVKIIRKQRVMRPEVGFRLYVNDRIITTDRTAIDIASTDDLKNITRIMPHADVVMDSAKPIHFMIKQGEVIKVKGGSGLNEEEDEEEEAPVQIIEEKVFEINHGNLTRIFHAEGEVIVQTFLRNGQMFYEMAFAVRLKPDELAYLRSSSLNVAGKNNPNLYVLREALNRHEKESTAVSSFSLPAKLPGESRLNLDKSVEPKVGNLIHLDLIKENSLRRYKTEFERALNMLKNARDLEEKSRMAVRLLTMTISIEKAHPKFQHIF